MAQPDLWFRTFTRNEGNDVDQLADSAFLQTNFTDFFGRWLQRGQNSGVLSLNALLMELWEGTQTSPQKNTLSTFSIADGGGFPITQDNATWLRNTLRFVVLAASGTEKPFDDATSDSWTLCIVGSSALDSNEAFLQVASWDTKTFRFYQRSRVEGQPSSVPQRWIYQGASVDAFTDEMSYLGPFNGHINGALVMKELHRPWPHWHTDNHSLVTNMPQRLKDRFKTAPYLTDQGTGSVFSVVKSAEILESFIEKGVSKWYTSRKSLDFLEAGNQLRIRPSNIRRWAAHLLLTTTINIAVAQTIGQKWRAPANHFYDKEMLSQYTATDLLKGVQIPKFEFSKDDYAQASQALGIAVIQDVQRVPAGKQALSLHEGTLGGGKQTNSFDRALFVQVQEGELDDMMFTILQPSFEDSQGVLVMQNIRSNHREAPTSLFSPRVFNALMVLDFWNPVYSWRRAALMQYIPTSTVYNETTGKYDLEDEFIANVKKSKFFLDEDLEARQQSPEFQFISLLDTALEEHQARIRQYLNSVNARLGTVDGLTDYIRLAESRRRIYRPLPINEFALTIPYALNYGPDSNARYEMTETGEIQPLPARGSMLLEAWTRTQDDGSLAGYDPLLFPKPDGAVEVSSSFAEPASFVAMSTRSVPARTGRCPYREVWLEV